jgi:hypothetical protein
MEIMHHRSMSRLEAAGRAELFASFPNGRREIRGFYFINKERRRPNGSRYVNEDTSGSLEDEQGRSKDEWERRSGSCRSNRSENNYATAGECRKSVVANDEEKQ